MHAFLRSYTQKLQYVLCCWLGRTAHAPVNDNPTKGLSKGRRGAAWALNGFTCAFIVNLPLPDYHNVCVYIYLHRQSKYCNYMLCCCASHLASRLSLHLLQLCLPEVFIASTLTLSEVENEIEGRLFRADSY